MYVLDTRKKLYVNNIGIGSHFLNTFYYNFKELLQYQYVISVAFIVYNQSFYLFLLPIQNSNII